MRIIVLWSLLFLITAAANARVPRESELTYNFQLKLEEGEPFIKATLTNHSSAPLEIELPAGLRFYASKKPTSIVVLGQSFLFNIPPKRSQTVSIQALGLTDHLQVEGEYTVALKMKASELALSAKLQEIWSLHYRSQLSGNPFRVGQLVAFLDNGVDLSSIKSKFSSEEIQSALKFVTTKALQPQPYSDRIVGYWVSSSGANLILAYSGKPTTFRVQVQTPQGGTTDAVAHWINKTRFTYKSADGSTINGWVNNSNSISVFNPATNWRQEWRRR